MRRVCPCVMLQGRRYGGGRPLVSGPLVDLQRDVERALVLAQSPNRQDVAAGMEAGDVLWRRLDPSAAHDISPPSRAASRALVAEGMLAAARRLADDAAVQRWTARKDAAVVSPADFIAEDGPSSVFKFTPRGEAASSSGGANTARSAAPPQPRGFYAGPSSLMDRGMGGDDDDEDEEGSMQAFINAKLKKDGIAKEDIHREYSKAGTEASGAEGGDAKGGSDASDPEQQRQQQEAAARERFARLFGQATPMQGLRKHMMMDHPILRSGGRGGGARDKGPRWT